MNTKTKNCSTENTKRHLFAQELHTQPVYYVDHGATKTICLSDPSLELKA
jgi:hypothetical protein